MPEVSWVWKWIGRSVSCAERRDQLPRRGRLEQARHVLDADDVGAGRLQLAREADIVFEAVLGAVGIEDVAGVADGALAELARLAHRVHRDAHVLDPVEAVEDAEEVDAARRPPGGRRSGRHCRDSWCSRRRWSRGAASAGGCSGACSRMSARRSHGSSVRKRMATSKVAPPQHSSERRPGSARE